jgi:hypothetical protein
VRPFRCKPVYRVALLEERLVKEETDLSALPLAAILQLRSDMMLLKERMDLVHSSQHNVRITVERLHYMRVEFGNDIWLSATVSDVRGHPFSPKWRGTRDGFDLRDIHSHCDRDVDTLMVSFNDYGFG